MKCEVTVAPPQGLTDSRQSNAFDTIKETLRISDVLALYGVEVLRANKALCPLHNEKTPSFTVYPNNNTWHCFGCGAGGSVIDFVMYCGLDALEAVKKLDSDYNLGIFGNKQPSQEEFNKLSEQRAHNRACKGLTTAFDAYINKAYILLCDYLHLLERWKVMYAPRPPEETGDMEKPMNPHFIAACHQQDYIKYLIDGLMQADFKAQMQFYKTHRKEMVTIAHKIKQYPKSRDAYGAALQ